MLLIGIVGFWQILVYWAELTVNSPVFGSKPTWTVCSKSMGEEISGLSLPLGREEREERGREREEREGEREERGRKGGEREKRRREGEKEESGRKGGEREREEERYHGTMSHTTYMYHNTCNLQTNKTSVTRCSYNGMPAGYSSWHMVNRRTLSLQNAHVISTCIVHTHSQ